MSLTELVSRLGSGALYATVATPLVFWAGLYYPSTTARASFFRFVTGVAAAAAVYVAVRRAGGRRSLREAVRELAFVALLGYAAVSVAAALLGEAPWKGIFGGVERMWGAMAWVHLAALYAAARVLLDDRRWTLFFRLSLGVAGLVAASGLLNGLGLLPGWAAVWPGANRGSSTMGNPGIVAAYLLLHLPVAGVAWARSSRWGGKAFALAAAALVVAGLLVSGSRSVLVGLAAGGLVAAAATALWGRSSRVRRLAAACLGTLLLAGALTWAYRDSAAVRSVPAVSRLANTDWRSGNMRYRLLAWDAAVEGFSANPVLGVGPENFDLVWDRFVDPAAHGVDAGTWRTERTHNAFLQSLATSGLPGALAYGGLWVAVLLSLYRGWRSGRLASSTAAAAAVGLTGYVVYLFFWFESVHTTFAWVALAAYLGHRASGGRWGKGEAPEEAPEAGEGGPGAEAAGGASVGGSRPAWAAAAAAGVLLLLAGSGLYHARLLQAAHHVDRVDRTRSASEKLAAGRKALKVRPPGVPKIVTRYSRLLIDLHGRLSDAPPDVRSRVGETLVAAMRRTDGELEEEIRASPSDARLRFVRSSLAAVAFNLSEEREDYATAVRAMEAAVENAPTTAVYRRSLAELYRMARRWEAAERVLREGLGVAPGPQIRIALARTLLEAGRPAEGAAQLAELVRSGHRPPEDLTERYRKALREAGEERALRALERALEGS